MDNPDRTTTHVQKALDNVQGNIRHIDTKVAGAMGLVTIVLGICVSRPILANQLNFSVPISLWFRIPELILLFSAVIILFLSVWYASKTIFPRTGTDPRLENKTWLLFPMAKTDCEAVVLRESLAAKAAKGMTDEDIVDEYLDQLSILGHIQTQKMVACKSLFKCVWAFCAVMLILGAVSLLCHMNLPFHVHSGVTCPHEKAVECPIGQAAITD